MVHRVKSGLRTSGRLSACADSPSFKKIAAGSAVPQAGGRAAPAIPFYISSLAHLSTGEEAMEGVQPKEPNSFGQ